jgi:hypothetical protein
MPRKPPDKPPQVREEKPYNPLAKEHLGESVAKALLEGLIQPLPPATAFTGAGIYAIYYRGKNALYGPIAAANQREFLQPIYIGKAVPEGARKGGYGLGENPGPVLYSRLRKHADSIAAAHATLSLEDFRCRYLVVDDIWIPLGEALLIETFQPLWNRVIEGFGNNDPGGRRYNQRRSPWDTLHEGRGWAKKCAPGTKTAQQLEAEVRAFLSRR